MAHDEDSGSPSSLCSVTLYCRVQDGGVFTVILDPLASGQRPSGIENVSQVDKGSRSTRKRLTWPFPPSPDTTSHPQARGLHLGASDACVHEQAAAGLSSASSFPL